MSATVRLRSEAPNTKPTLQAASFVCPSCNHLANQKWDRLAASGRPVRLGAGPDGNLWIATCQACRDQTIWRGPAMLYPQVSIAPAPVQDTPDDVRALYEEAREVFASSPKSAAALLRLGLEKLLAHLGETVSINDGIKNLVKKGVIDDATQQAMDALRLIGNSAVHGGFIDPNEDPNTAAFLFALLNDIVVETITRKARAARMFGLVPEAKQQEIKKRDGK